MVDMNFFVCDGVEYEIAEARHDHDTSVRFVDFAPLVRRLPYFQRAIDKPRDDARCGCRIVLADVGVNA